VGEIFRWERPKQELQFTGERFTSKISGQIEIEHLHRYFLARELSRGKAVLDIASGEGYGSSLVSQVAKSVVGIDIDADTVLHASQAYKNPRLNFVCADLLAMPLANSSIDFVISFETIEHIYDHLSFINEIHRILKPNGTLMMSTPDRDVYSPADSQPNLFHVKELAFDEFKQILEQNFKSVSILLQRPMLGSVLLPAYGAVIAGHPVTFESRGADYFEGSEGLPRAVYMIALASAHPVSVTPASVYIEASGIGLRIDALMENQRLETLFQEARSENERLEPLFQVAQSENQRLEALFKKARLENERLEPLLQAAQSENQRLEALLKEARSESERLETLFQTARSENERLEALFQEARSENLRLQTLFQEIQSENRRLSRNLRMIESSISWRILAPLRVVYRLLRRRS
jgi:ubiquinone/menaquinone biosynthesis C-methylase UbiE